MPSMNTSSLKNAAANSPPSVAKDALMAALSGQIQMAVAQKIVAIHTASTLSDHVPTEYPFLPVEVEMYQTQRLSGSGRQEGLAIQNGEWFDFAHRALLENQHEVEYLLWAHGLCVEAGNTEASRKIDAHLEYFRNHNFPEQKYKNAMQVQKMDSRDRQRKVTE